MILLLRELANAEEASSGQSLSGVVLRANPKFSVAEDAFSFYNLLTVTC
jgi:hypothetical protein